MKAQSPGRKAARTPLDSLSSFVNSFELKAVRSKISHSASSLGRSVSRFAELPLFDHSESDNDTTLDDDWLASPSQKHKPPAPADAAHSAAGSPSRTADLQSNEHLPHTSIRTYTVPTDSIPRIDVHQMARLLRGDHAGQFDEFVVVDCRFPYEYDGGHIAGAVNVCSQHELAARFMGSSAGTGTRLLVFHCEYSLLRGPTMAGHLRRLDREHNGDRYPHLSCPDVVVLDGGYKTFFDRYRAHCVPQAYVEMRDTAHRRTCQIEMSKVLQASKLTRAKSYSLLQPRSAGTHTRSASLTALLSADGAAAAAPLAKRRSTKVKKHRKERAFATPLAIPPPGHASCESPMASPGYLHFDHDDFAPPCALFRNHSTSSSVSINSSQSSLYSDSLAVSYSSDSLSESVSPFTEAPDDPGAYALGYGAGAYGGAFGAAGFGSFSNAGTGAGSNAGFGGGAITGFGSSATPGFGSSATPGFGSSATPGFGSSSTGFGSSATPGFDSNSPGATPGSGACAPGALAGFTTNSPNPKKPKATNKLRITPRPIRPPMKLSVSSPTVSSPLSSFHGFDSAKSSSSIISIDPINKTPVEFSGFKSSYRQNSDLDLHELSEESS